MHAPPPSGGRAGFALVDFAVALVLLLVTVGGLFGVVSSAARVASGNEETARAVAEARRIAEELYRTPFSEIFTTFQPGDLDVEGLLPRRDDVDGRVASVRFPTVQGLLGPELREDLQLPRLGLPRDLNGDGDAVDDAAADYRILPVTIRLEWTGAGGDRSVQFDMLLRRSD